MNTIQDRLFLCYAWEDSADVQSIIADIEHELNAKIVSTQVQNNSHEINDAVINALDNSDIFIVFITDSSKKSDYVKQCVVRAQNLNKNILPVKAGQSSFWDSMPSEFKFRSKTYSYKNEESKAQLFAQLKVALGFHVENGDIYGALIHIVTDKDARINRYGEDLGIAYANEDFTIRLTKGTHLLNFISIEDESLNYSTSYQVENNDGEQFLNVPFAEMVKKKREEEEKAKREEELKRKFEEEQYEKNLELEQRRKELEIQREQQELERQQQLIAQQNSIKEEKGGLSGCAITIIVVLGIIQPWTLLISLPYIYFKKKKNS